MVPFTITLLATLAAAPFIRAHLVRRGLMDIPNHRSSHTVPVPRGGGIACLAGILAGAVASAARGEAPWGAVGAALALGVVGLVDDRRGLRPVPRLAAQCLTGAVAGAAIGVDLGLGARYAVVLAAVGAAVMVLSVNVVNFMDGINGITALTVIVWGGTMAWAGTAYDLTTVRVAGLLALGAALGFLPFNAPRARLFLGDAGSYGFGALIGTTSLYAVAHHVPWFVVFAPMTPYLVDVLVTLGKRALAHRPLLDAHREHLYQRLTDTRLGHSAVATLFAAAAALAAASAVLTGSGTTVTALAAVGAVLVAGARRGQTL